MRKWIIVAIALCVLCGGAWFFRDAFQDYKSVTLDCVTPNSWNVPKIFPDNLNMPDAMQPLTSDLYWVGYRDKNGVWYFLMLFNDPSHVAMCQEQVMTAETDTNGVKRFWKYVDDKPVEVDIEEYRRVCHELFSRSMPPEPQEESREDMQQL